MRRSPTILALLVALGGMAGSTAAAPAQKKSDSRAAAPLRDDVQITVRAGRGRLGITALQISPALRRHLGAPADQGVLIDNVRPDSPAARAGLHVGDVVIAVDGEPTRSAGDVLDAMADRKKGEVVAISVVRASKTMHLDATLVEDPGPMPAWSKLGDFDFERFGLDDMPFSFQPFEDKELRRSLEESRKRIEELERRLEKLERT